MPNQKENEPAWKVVSAKRPHVCRLCNRQLPVGTRVMRWKSYVPRFQGFFTTYFCSLGECLPRSETKTMP